MSERDELIERCAEIAEHFHKSQPGGGYGSRDDNIKNYAEIAAAIRALRAEAVPGWSALAEFARWAITEGPWDGSSLDGGSVQEKAESLGLIVKTKYDPAIHGDSDCAEPGDDDWYVFSDMLAASPSPPQDGWRTMESAPKDGAYLIANQHGQVCQCSARKGMRTVHNVPGYADWDWLEDATHWQPLPSPPAPGWRPEAKILLLLRIIEAAGGQIDASDDDHSMLNFFCNDGPDRHAVDTFNQAINRKLIRTTFSDEGESSTAFLTDAGRAMLAASPSKEKA